MITTSELEIYKYPTETIEAIIRGLDIKKGDRIISVLGSGLGALAMAAIGADVFCYDINSLQIEYFNKFRSIWEEKAEQLEKIPNNSDYFLNNPLKKSYNNPHVWEGDIYVINWAGRNKIYLSNTWPEERGGLMEILFKKKSEITKDTLIYLAIDWFNKEDFKSLNKAGIEIDEELTNIARKYEMRKELWAPIVLRVTN